MHTCSASFLYDGSAIAHATLRNCIFCAGFNLPPLDLYAPLESPTAPAEQLTDAQLQTMLTELRRHLHQYPEVGFEEHETSNYIRNWLVLEGFTPQGPIAKTGF